MTHQIIRKADGTVDSWETVQAAQRAYGQGIEVEGSANLVLNYGRNVGERLMHLLARAPEATEIEVL